MSRSVCLSVLFAACVGLAGSALASGSAGPGAKAGGRGDYAHGKSITFRQLVCDSCPIGRAGFDRDRAAAVKQSIDAALGGGAPTDELRAFCAAGERRECAEKLRLVRRFLERRYRL